jgi:hypothetical protein
LQFVQLHSGEVAFPAAVPISTPLLPAGCIQLKPLPLKLPLELEMSFRRAKTAVTETQRRKTTAEALSMRALEQLKRAAAAAVVDVHESLHAGMGAVSAAASRAGIAAQAQGNAIPKGNQVGEGEAFTC